MKRTLYLLVFAALTGTAAIGQIDCGSTSASANKLVCQFPVATGLLTNDTALGGGASSPSAAQAAAIFDSAVATQVSQLPLATASAGEVTVLDQQKIPHTVYDLGPILTDRAKTIGRRHFFLGFTASQYVFTDLDGISLRNLSFGFQSTATDRAGNPISTTFTTETTKLSFRVDQFIAVATLGLTNKMDMSVIVPSERVSLGANTFNSISYIQSAASSTAIGPIHNQPNDNTGTASGVGDITFNVKRELWSGERAVVSAAMNLRAPTGDEQNFLGSGAWGFDPYVIYSFRYNRFSPHAKIGYQWNSSTDLNYQTNSSTGIAKNQPLPGGVNYDLGAEWAVRSKITLAGDLLGSQYLNSPTIVLNQLPVKTDTGTVKLNTSVSQIAGYSINTVSTGFKLKPGGNLVLSANVLFQVNNNGLRSRPTPLLGISYSF